MTNLAIVYSRAQQGLASPLIRVEVHISNGLPGLSIVGLAETSVKESKDRVRAALLNTQFQYPKQRITINLSPADLPKEGSRFDLPIALGILAASGQIPKDKLEHYEFLGELALTGELREVGGSLSAALQSQHQNRSLVLPWQNREEAALVKQAKILPSKHLLDVCAHLQGQNLLSPTEHEQVEIQANYPHDIADVKGQTHAKRALEIVAAGGHGLLMLGPPGTGKSLLASCLPSILPPLNETEALEVATITSLQGKKFTLSQWKQRPFRHPHHTASAVALVGGGTAVRPGEISLAHHGVLFLDELPEFDRKVLEVLREPMEAGKISISRANRQVEYPARFQLIAAMNPCPCGYLGDANGRCHCTPKQIQRYRSKISGPLLDRIDLQIEVPAIHYSELQQAKSNDIETSATVRERVIKARIRQQQRTNSANQFLSNAQIEQVCALDSSGQKLLQQAVQRLGLSPRAYHRILKVARTIADLAESETIQASHLSEAISYRRLDRCFR